MTTPTTALQTWGYSEGAGLPEALAEFLREAVGEAAPRPAVDPSTLRFRASRLSEEDLEALRAVVSVTLDDQTRWRCSGGFSFIDLCERRWPDGETPVVDAVVVPDSHDQVAAVLAECSARRIAVVPFGGGTSVVRGLSADFAAVIGMAFWGMADVLSLDAESGEAVVQPGITGPDFERWLAGRGFTWGHVPQSWERATVGGYAATRSSGQASSGYGRSDATVTKLRVATPAGEFLLGHGPASAAGPDLRQVFIGSEGSFGVLTEVGVRVRPLPEQRVYEAFLFPNFAAGSGAFRQAVQHRDTPDVMRLSDRDETAVTLAMSGMSGLKAQMFEKYAQWRKVAEGCLAIVGWEGPSDAVKQRRRDAHAMFRTFGGVGLGQSVGKSWEHGRFHGPYLRDDLLDAGYLVETLETANNWSALEDTHQQVASALREALGSAVVGAHLSHIYPTGASLYFTVITPLNADPVGQWRGAKQAATDAIVATGATITHHHAVGRDHAPWLASEIGVQGVSLLAAIKAHVDPQGIMNPGVLGLG